MLWLLGVGILAGTGAGVAAADDPSAIEAAPGPMDPSTGQLEMSVPAGSAEGRLDFFVRQDGSEPISNVSIEAIGAAVPITVAPRAGNPMTIPSAGGVVLVTATATGLNEPLDVRVPLVAIRADGSTQPLATLRVVRADAPALTIVGAQNGSLSFEQDRESFRRDIVVRSDSGADVHARISFSPLQHGSSAQAPLTVELDGEAVTNGAEIEIPARERRTLTISSALTRAGSYTGDLSLTYGKNQASNLDVVVTVTRTETEQTVVADPVAAARAVRPLCRSLPPCTASGAVEVTLRETKGEPASFDKLQVRSVVVDDGGTNVQTPYTSKVQARGGQPDAAIVVGPRDSIVVTAEIGGLTGAGKHEVQLRGTTPGAAPLDITAIVLVRDSWLRAALVILAGVLLSWLLRSWLTNGRQHLQLQIKMDELSQRLTQVVQTRGELPGTADTIARVRERLNRASERTRERDSAAASQTMVEDGAARIEMLDQWLQVVATARSAGRAAVAEDQLELARGGIVASGAVTADRRAAFDAALGKAREQLDAADSEQLANDVTRILGVDTPPPGFATQADWDKLRREVRQLAVGVGAQAKPGATLDQYRRLLTGMGEGIREAARQQALALRAQNFEQHADAFAALDAPASQAIREAAVGYVVRAQQTYNDVASAYTRLTEELKAAGQLQGSAAPAEAVELEKMPDVPELAPILPARWAKQRKVRFVVVDNLVLLGLAVLVVLIGLISLYLPSKIWGAPLDYLTAFLWGMGLFQVGGAASDGIEGVRKKLTEPANA
ncbi:MAG TPA: hypothetical protein VIT65_09350 [Microlunatus sp.]